jgi:hypothetical protein
MSTVDDTSDARDMESVIILAQVQTMLINDEDPSMTNDKNKLAMILAQNKKRKPINSDLVLIYSQ